MSNDWIEISAVAIGAESATQFVADARAGGIAVFLGTTRGETSASGHALIALDYEAYEEMALGQLRALVGRVRGNWPVIKIAVRHRIGRVMVGEPSVVIAVSTPHRAEAFAACHWLIDELKKDVAIWKKEVWDGGGQRWVE
jgi:molybdopterin synthase catalytic subunit